VDGTTKAEASFREEALPHLDAVYRFALRLARAPDGAEDLVQETFLRAYRHWDQYTPGTNCKSWLFTICRNVFLRQRERVQRHDEIIQENLEAGGVIAGTGVPIVNQLWLDTGQVDPEGRFFASIIDTKILEAIDGLPEDYRTAVVLSDLEGLSYDEMSSVMDVPIGTVKSRLFRGRRRLQQQLYEYAVEAGFLAPRREADG
jgi:RNA polymerase sigma-70 factor (ECF subfamily)